MTLAGAPAPRIDHYDWPGGREPMLRFGPEGGVTALVALPLLEEANRTRALAVAILRMLAARGIAGALPELPGTGESAVPTEAVRLADLHAAFAAAAAGIGGLVLPVAIRSGALVDVATSVRAEPFEARDAGDTAPGPPFDELRTNGGEGRSVDRGTRWHLSPQTGADVVREWRRLRDAGNGVMVAGNRIAPALWADLADAEPLPGRVVRLAGDPRPADRVVAAPPPWRRAEPDADLALAAVLADDIAGWIARCGG